VLSPRVHDLSPHAPSIYDGPESLWVPDASGFDDFKVQTETSVWFSSELVIWWQVSPRRSTNLNFLSLRASAASTSHLLLPSVSPDPLTCVPSGSNGPNYPSQIRISWLVTSKLQLPPHSQLLKCRYLRALKYEGSHSSGFNGHYQVVNSAFASYCNFSPLTSLMCESVKCWSLATRPFQWTISMMSGLRNFTKPSLLCNSKGLKLMHVPLNSMTIGPHAQIWWLRSGSSVIIPPLPRRRSNSLGSFPQPIRWLLSLLLLNFHLLPTWNIFVNVWKVSDFELSSTNPTPLGLTYNFESIISSDLMDLE